jgi:hypothetical protein
MRAGRWIFAIGMSAATAVLIVGQAGSQGLPGARTAGSGAAVPQAAALGPGRQAGIAWAASLDDARARAKREAKPVLLLHLFGRLDEEFC